MSRHVDAAVEWIYRGVWASVVALFRVPERPPTLPVAGEPVRSLRPALGFLNYLKFFFWLMFIPGDVIPIAGWVAIWFAAPVLAIALLPVLVIVVFAPDVMAYVGIHLQYDTTWYVLTDRSLRIRRGVWTIHETTISFENVQNVEVSQGPVQRYFGIADVIVQTAGGGARHGKGEGSSSAGAHVGVLQGLDEAEAIRDVILDRVRRTRSAGLGDERAATPSSVGSAAGFSPAHLRVLREIRDGARRLAEASIRRAT
jgi:membrane protein YdbS with pleckstrin-like domain